MTKEPSWRASARPSGIRISAVAPRIVVLRPVISAQIGLRLTGGADALASLLQTKLFRSLAGAEIESVRLPLSVTGRSAMSGTASRESGKSTRRSAWPRKDGRFALAYDRNGFSLKGDGRLAGAPLTVDLHQAKAARRPSG
jgi:hypothetical protein